MEGRFRRERWLISGEGRKALSSPIYCHKLGGGESEDRDMSSRRFGSACAAIIAVCFVLSPLAVIDFGQDAPHSESPARIMYASHSPISIDGNADFATKALAESWSGDGSPGNPYIIQGYDINAASASGISIQNTNAHFIVRDCYFHNGSSSFNCGISLYNCSNGFFSNDYCSGNWVGIGLGSSSNNNTLSNNNCSNNWAGIDFNVSSDNTLSNNTCSNNYYGISLGTSSNNNILTDNTCSNNQYGMTLSYSSNNTLSNNNCSSNVLHGIELSSSSDNTLSNNTCSNNYYGIWLVSSSSNTLSNNNCTNNWEGISLWSSSDNNALINNTCSSNNHGGIFLWLSSDNNTLINNNCSSNNYYGIYLNSSNDNTIVWNQICNNFGYGIYADAGPFGTDRNMILNNTFAYNYGSCDYYIPGTAQARDSGTGNHWNSSGYGNYWSDWGLPDDDSNGIVDAPYSLSGSAGAIDYYPLSRKSMPDIDGDGMIDVWEMHYLLNSNDKLSDADADGLNNFAEYNNLTNPRVADTDMDGMPDGWEVTNGLNPIWAGDATLDADGDGLANYQEYLLGSDINDPDTDSDMMPDGWEAVSGLNPIDASDAKLDADNDGLSNLGEYQHQTDPNDWDTDGDDLSDGVEMIFSNTDPLDADTDGNGIGDGLQFIGAGGYSAMVQLLPNGWIGMQIFWSSYTISVKTNSSVLSATFNKDNKTLTIGVSGPSGTTGACQIVVPKAMINSSSDISVFLDDQAINFTLTQNDTYYTIDITYTHSTHELMTGFAHSSGTPPAETPAPAIPLELIAGAVAAIAAIFAIAMVARGRKKGKDEKKATGKDSRKGDKPSGNKGKKQPPAQRPTVQRRVKTGKGN